MSTPTRTHPRPSFYLPWFLLLSKGEWEGVAIGGEVHGRSIRPFSTVDGWGKDPCEDRMDDPSSEGKRPWWQPKGTRQGRSDDLPIPPTRSLSPRVRTQDTPWFQGSSTPSVDKEGRVGGQEGSSPATREVSPSRCSRRGSGGPGLRVVKWERVRCRS